MNTQVNREPVNPEQTQQDIDDIFVFRAPISQEHSDSCQKVQQACKDLAKLIAQEVPEGKEQTIAINNLLSTALFARHGITKRQVLVMSAIPQEEMPPSEVVTPSADATPAGSNSEPSPT